MSAWSSNRRYKSMPWRTINRPAWERQRNLSHNYGAHSPDLWNTCLTQTVYAKSHSKWPWFGRYEGSPRYEMGVRPVKGIHSHGGTRKYAKKRKR